MDISEYRLPRPGGIPVTDLPQPTSILLVDPKAAERCVPSLRTRFQVTAVSTEEQAIRALRAFEPTLVITELTLSQGDGVSVCRHAKASPTNPARVLITTAAGDRVPEALLAGCDGVLMKPFAPTLLHTRIGRLLEQRTKPLREGCLLTGTNVIWRDRHCPSCGKGDIVSFDAAGYRRLWYACLPCRKVWIAAGITKLRPYRKVRGD